MKYTALALAIALTASAAHAGWDHGPQAPVGGPGYGEGAAQENDIHGDGHSGDDLDRGGWNETEDGMSGGMW